MPKWIIRIPLVSLTPGVTVRGFCRPGRSRLVRWLAVQAKVVIDNSPVVGHDILEVGAPPIPVGQQRAFTPLPKRMHRRRTLLQVLRQAGGAQELR
jgi:hypothetical protein